jgi:hypothetical protein
MTSRQSDLVPGDLLLSFWVMKMYISMLCLGYVANTANWTLKGVYLTAQTLVWS